ncbi:MAG: alkaline phosphatase [Desulfobacterales bacterium]|jgi:alkaline phosphatase
MKKVILTALAICLIFSLNTVVFAKHGGEHAKNIIFMCPDGMGISNVTAARIFKNGPNGDRLALESLKVIGHQSTHAKNSTVTDSAAAATAWAIGQKANNGEISCTRNEEENGDCTGAPKTILEIAKEMGKATGLVATSQISHATPAAFGAHAGNRYCGEEIARQYIEETGVDVVLGGGVYYTNTAGSRCPWAASLPGTGLGQDGIIESAVNNGYAVVQTKGQMNALTSETKVLGLFKDFSQGKTVEYFRVGGTPYPGDEPTLAEMTEAALDILDNHKRGFFLMVEGSQIDWEDHANNAVGMIAETLGFDAAVEVVRDWLQKGNNAQHTLVIIAPDHDTSGYAIKGPYGSLSEAGDLLDVESGNGAYISGDHTGTDVVIWSEGPGSENLGEALDNTDLFHVMMEALHN